MNVAITGGNTNWGAGIALAVSGDGVTVNSVTVQSPTSLLANLSIAADATQSARDVTATTPLGASNEVAMGTNVIVVGAAAAFPTVTSVQPSTVAWKMKRATMGDVARLAAVSKELPREATFRRLPSSHRVELLRLKVPENVERLASKAISGKLSVQKLRALIQKEVERTSAASDRGRKRTPTVVRAIEACLRAVRDEETGRLLFRRSDIDNITEEQVARAQTALASLEKRVADLRRLLG